MVYMITVADSVYCRKAFDNQKSEKQGISFLASRSFFHCVNQRMPTPKFNRIDEEIISKILTEAIAFLSRCV